jgi:hypothetical protein
MTNPTDNGRGVVPPTLHTSPPRYYESAIDNAVSYARTEGLPEARIQEILRSPYSTPCDLWRAADTYNDD